MNAVRNLATRIVIAIGVSTLIVDLIFHHHVGAQILTGVAYLTLATVAIFDLSNAPALNSQFCLILTPEEVKSFRINHLALLYPGAAHFYSAVLTAFAMVGVLWAVAAFLDHGYITATALVALYFLTAGENIRLAPEEHVARSASAGNPVAIMRQIHWKSITEKLASHHERQNAAASALIQQRLARNRSRDP